MTGEEFGGETADAAIEREERAINPFGQMVRAEGSAAVAEAVAQREIAEVQAQVLMAKKFPRDPIVAMDRILQECARPTLAEVAVYEYARGGTEISGPSIRLAEVIARQWGNMLSGVREVSRSNGKSECEAFAWDLETNYKDSKIFVVRHWRDTKRGGYALTDERDIYEKIANDGARRKRACILGVVPGDLVEHALKQCELTMKSRVEITPERLKEMVAKFEAYGITQEHIEKRVQRRLESITPALVVQLGKIYNSLRDGMSQPGDWFDIVQERATAPVDEKLKGKSKAASQRQAPSTGEKEPEDKDASEPTESPGTASILGSDLDRLTKLAKDAKIKGKEFADQLAIIEAGSGTPEEKVEHMEEWIAEQDGKRQTSLV